MSFLVIGTFSLMKAPFDWQAPQWQQLQERRKTGRLAHAILLQGPALGGKRHFAEAFAEGLLCQQPLTNGSACGACSPCILLKAGNHPDLIHLTPESDMAAEAAEERKTDRKTDKKSEKASHFIKVEAIRDFIETETLSSHHGGYKVAILDPAEAMNTSAANALLKTLEEPRPSTLILLISSRPDRLLPTIRSRCQALGFPLPPRNQALNWLAGQGTDADWPLLLAVAGGAPFKALQLANPDIIKARADLLSEALALLEGRQDPILLAEAWSKEDMTLGFEWLASLLMDLMRLEAVPGHRDLFNPDLADQLQRLAPRFSAKKWQHLQSELIKSRKALNQQLNLQLQLEALLTLFHNQ